MNGLMMDDFQLSLTTLVERAEQLSPRSEVIARLGDGSIRRTEIGACAQRARRLATGLAGLGIDAGDRVATLLWNQTEHLELYFAVPLMGAVLHTLNPRLSADDLSYIAADAGDRVIVVDESLLHVLEGIDWEFERVIVVSAVGFSAGGRHPLRVADCDVGADDLAGDRRAQRRGDVLHVGHDRPAQGRDLLTPRPGPAFAGVCPA